MSKRSALSAVRFVAAVLCAGVVLSSVAAGNAARAADKTYVMKMSTATLNDTQHEYLKRLAAALKKDSKGRIKPQIYPASQLGSIPRQIEGVQFGSIQMWVGPPGFLVGIDPRFELLAAPGIFDSMAHASRTVHDPEFDKVFLKMGVHKGLVGTALFMSAPTSFNTRTPVRHIADFKGLKLRVLASSLQMAQIKVLGGTAVPMALGDVLPALQQGTIDGAMSTVPVLEALHYYDAAKYMTETDQAYIVSMATLSKSWLDSLPADLRKLVLDESAKIGRGMFAFADKFFEDGRKKWTQHGGELIRLPADEQARMMKELASVGPEVVKGKPALEKMYAQVVAAAKRNKK